MRHPYGASLPYTSHCILATSILLSWRWLEPTYLRHFPGSKNGDVQKSFPIHLSAYRIITGTRSKCVRKVLLVALAGPTKCSELGNTDGVGKKGFHVMPMLK